MHVLLAYTLNALVKLGVFKVRMGLLIRYKRDSGLRSLSLCYYNLFCLLELSPQLFYYIGNLD
jgi:hypothetical protein